MRKLNYAANVNRIMPLGIPNRCGLSSICSIKMLTVFATAIDKCHGEAYLHLRIIGDEYGQVTRSQKPSLGARRRAQSKSRSSPRPPVHRQSVFRSQGSGAGPLRDGAAPQHRWHVDQRRRGRFRLFPADLLQDTKRACSRRVDRACATPAGPQRWPQDLGRGGGLCYRSQGRQPRADNAGVPRRDRNPFQHHAAPAQLGASAGGQKKRLDPN